MLNSTQIPVSAVSCCPEGLQQSLGSNTGKNLEGTGMEQFYKEFKNNVTICIYIQKQGCGSEHAVTSYLN